MKNLFILAFFIASGCSFALGEYTTKEQDEIPANLLGKGPITIGKINQYMFSQNYVTLHFIIDGAHPGKIVNGVHEGKSSSFMVSFSRSTEVKSHAHLRVKEGNNTTDYRLVHRIEINCHQFLPGRLS